MNFCPINPYLAESFVGQPMWKLVATSAHLPPWRLLSRQCSDQLLVTVPFLSLHRGHRTAYHLPSELFHPSPPFGNNWRHICLGSVLADFFTTFLTVIMTLYRLCWWAKKIISSNKIAMLDIVEDFKLKIFKSLTLRDRPLSLLCLWCSNIQPF